MLRTGAGGYPNHVCSRHLGRVPVDTPRTQHEPVTENLTTMLITNFYDLYKTKSSGISITNDFLSPAKITVECMEQNLDLTKSSLTAQSTSSNVKLTSVNQGYNE